MDIPSIKKRGDRGGIMHRKYCMIDYHITISGLTTGQTMPASIMMRILK